MPKINCSLTVSHDGWPPHAWFPEIIGKPSSEHADGKPGSLAFFSSNPHELARKSAWFVVLSEPSLNEVASETPGTSTPTPLSVTVAPPPSSGVMSTKVSFVEVYA